ncbi:ATP-binding cassette, subfamily C [Caldanaerobius fijiensis DSM 17918]|uniref:ATP-binding cassette, subfamily C n=1 Tax=Caldanaerobius fijiensis DSM 17918 TaxID=1121256 RepID=A0A1M4VCS8_9THEO|nr:ABC transporter ATP-binding protein [Caldanaerobius fijiensis]SHE66723.1 ATP-binding cassette, subfamily C [Caldanaerobius fijiensis DSM 17918]
MSNHIRLKIMDKAQRVDQAYYDIPEYYNKMENAMREVSYRPVTIVSSSFTFFSYCTTLISYSIVLMRFSPWVPVLVILSSIPNGIVQNKFKDKVFEVTKTKVKERRQMNYLSNMVTSKDFSKEIRLFGIGNYIVSRYKNVFNKYFVAYKGTLVKSSLWNFMTSLLIMGVIGALSVWLGISALKGYISLGDFSLYTSSLFNIHGYINMVITVGAFVAQGNLYIGNLRAFLEQKSHLYETSKKIKPRRSGEHYIKFENVSFKYPGTDRYVLKDINLEIYPGETIALVGLNGAGKSTLVKLLIRLYDPTEGRILLDDIDLKEYDIEALRSLYGVVFQDFCRYAFTVEENIAIGDIDNIRDKDRIYEAAVKSKADEFIRNLPRGYETSLTREFEDDGIELSIGQWQKLALARAFFRDADILILDEPTASLDVEAEYEVFKLFDQLRENRTTVFISHRLSSATIASKIVFIKDGMISEVGTHRELMEKGGDYARLFKMQAERYQE